MSQTQNQSFVVSSSPHIRANEDTRSIMLDVIIALVPSLVLAVYFFGWRSLSLACVSVIACIFFEWGYRALLKKPMSIGDLSAVVTGILIAFNLPVTTPYWMVIVGAFIAIVVCKQLFGGLGKNFMNPALVARVFLFSWPTVMNTWAAPVVGDFEKAPSVFGNPMADVITSATPLSYMKNGIIPSDVFELRDLLLGQRGGSLGEVSVLLLLLGGVYLVVRRVINPRIPLAFIGTVALLTFLFPLGDNARLDWMLYSIMSGGLMLGAVFMATDYSTSPVTPWGQIFFGIGCGLFTVLIRYFGSYPEGVSYSILIMNACVWLLDKATMPRRYGVPLLRGRAPKVSKPTREKGGSAE